MSRARVRAILSASAAALLVAGLTSGCAGWGGSSAGSGGANSVDVLMVNNPQMIDLQRLTAANFTKQTGISVNFTVLPENDVRDKISQEFSSQAGQYDVASLSNFEIPIYAKSKWIAPLDDYTKAETQFDQANMKVEAFVRVASVESGDEVRKIDATPNGATAIAYAADAKTMAFATMNAIH